MREFELSGSLLVFLRECSEEGLRITYAGLTKLAGHLGLVPEESLPADEDDFSSFGLVRLVESLPVDLQASVCLEDGKYGLDSFRMKPVYWHLHSSRSIIPAVRVLDAFRAWEAR